MKHADEMMLIADMVQTAVFENAHIALDQNECRQRNYALATLFAKAKKKYAALTNQIVELENCGQSLHHFQETLESFKGTITELDSVFWEALVDYITVYEDRRKRSHSRMGLHFKA